MEKIATFRSFPHIGEKIFLQLNHQTFLKSRLVCKDWYSILSNPLFWLKRFKSVHQSEEISENWMQLIEKSREIGDKSTHNLALCMTKVSLICERTFCHYTAKINQRFMKVFISQPPLQIAAKYNFVEIAKLCIATEDNFNDQFPLEIAIFNENFELAKLILFSMKTPLDEFTTQNDESPLLHLVASYGNVELMELIVPHFKNINLIHNEETPIICAIDNEKYGIEIVKYLAPKSDLTLKTNRINLNALEYALQYKNVEAVKILVPLMQDFISSKGILQYFINRLIIS